MKKILLTITLFACSRMLEAQVIHPAIEKGTTFYYALDLHGQHSPMELSVNKMTDTLVLDWRIRRLAAGTYKMTPASRERATRLNFSQPMPNKIVTLPAHETFLIISTKAFQDLAKNRRFTYDNTTYVCDTSSDDSSLYLDGKALDVIHVRAIEETMELWILNNKNFPLICRTRGNPMGVEFLVKSVK